MYKKRNHSWIKHLDFMIFDLIILAASYIFVVLLRFDFYLSSGQISLFTRLGIIMLVLYLLVSIIGQNYKSILQRGIWVECYKIFLQLIITFLLVILYMFVTKQSALFSRIVFGFTGIVAFVLIFCFRVIYKRFLRHHIRRSERLSQLLIVTDRANLESSLKAVEIKSYNAFNVKGIALCGENMVGETISTKRGENEKSYPVLASDFNLKEYILSAIIDEIFINLSDENEEKNLTEYFLETGITVHIGIANKSNNFPNAALGLIGNTMVITTSNNTVSQWKLAVKRAVDILGGIIGCLITGVLFIILAPQIKSKDKGPALFKQIRIGKNGRQFYIYKFRSMYMDAEKRKKELMAQNEMDGLMFKMENDPRILPGIGHKIRDWSLDEFPQFFNVLKGDMSLVGTRPPTLEEFSHYEAHHKMRLSFKPGITGFWQVSGRNDITDFEEVVALDNEYIKDWKLSLDFKILFKTIKVVLKREGSK